MFDITAAILIWRFGLPEFIDRSGAQHIITGDTDHEEKAKAETYDRWSKIGLILLVTGFLGQLISTWIR